jgi:hypothetical protein
MSDRRNGMWLDTSARALWVRSLGARHAEYVSCRIAQPGSSRAGAAPPEEARAAADRIDDARNVSADSRQQYLFPRRVKSEANRGSEGLGGRRGPSYR